MFKLNDRVVVVLGTKKIIGQVVGIDSYTMESFDNKIVRWTSHTLVTKEKGFLSRCWLINRGKFGWYLSTGTKKKKIPTKAKLVLERSGLTKIDFTGENGISAPTSALVVYKLRNESFFGLERFSGSVAYCFESRKVQKPKRV